MNIGSLLHSWRVKAHSRSAVLFDYLHMIPLFAMKLGSLLHSWRVSFDLLRTRKAHSRSAVLFDYLHMIPLFAMKLGSLSTPGESPSTCSGQESPLQECRTLYLFTLRSCKYSSLLKFTNYFFMNCFFGKDTTTFRTLYTKPMWMFLTELFI